MKRILLLLALTCSFQVFATTDEDHQLRDVLAAATNRLDCTGQHCAPVVTKLNCKKPKPPGRYECTFKDSAGKDHHIYGGLAKDVLDAIRAKQGGYVKACNGGGCMEQAALDEVKCENTRADKDADVLTTCAVKAPAVADPKPQGPPVQLIRPEEAEQPGAGTF